MTACQNLCPKSLAQNYKALAAEENISLFLLFVVYYRIS